MSLPYETSGPDPTGTLEDTAVHLLAIQGACQFVLDIADQRITLNDNTIVGLRDSLKILDAAGPLPGRLGYLTRQLNRRPRGTYGDIVEELAFALHLNDRSMA